MLRFFLFCIMDIDQLRDICLQLPAVTEDIKWGHDLAFSVGEKMFCVAGLESPFKCTLKVQDEEFEELCNRQGIMPAPYLARAKWIQIDNSAKLSKKSWEELILNSYEMIKGKLTKKQKNDLGI